MRSNADLGEYLVPVSADVPDVDVVLLDESDFRHNELGVRGAGEIGAGGVSAAIRDAIHHAVGLRLRDMPMTVDRMFSTDGIWGGTPR